MQINNRGELTSDIFKYKPYIVDVRAARCLRSVCDRVTAIDVLRTDELFGDHLS